MAGYSPRRPEERYPPISPARGRMPYDPSSDDDDEDNDNHGDASPAAGPSRHPIALPMLHLGSFRSLSLKDFAGPGVSPTSDASSPGRSPRTPGLGTGSGEQMQAQMGRAPSPARHAGDRSPRFGAAPDADMPTFRAAQIPRRLTVVERPSQDHGEDTHAGASGVREPPQSAQRSKSSTRPESGVLRDTPARSGRTHQSEAAELGTLLASTPGSSVDRDVAEHRAGLDRDAIPPVPQRPPHLEAPSASAQDDWVPSFPQPPVRIPSPHAAAPTPVRPPPPMQEIRPLNVPHRQRTPSNQHLPIARAERSLSGGDLGVRDSSTGKPPSSTAALAATQTASLRVGATSSSPLSPERRKRRLPSTPISPSQLAVTPGVRSVSSSVPLGSAGPSSDSAPRAPQRILSSPFRLDPEQLPQSVQPARSRSAPGLDPRIDTAEQCSAGDTGSYARVPPAPYDRGQPLASGSRQAQAAALDECTGQRAFADDIRRLRAEQADAMHPQPIPHIDGPPLVAATPSATQAPASFSPSRAAIPDYLAMDMSGGPYPVYNRPLLEVEQDRQAQDVGNVRISQRQVKQTQTPVRVKLPPAQEEVCLECMMRDRDLIHIDVTTVGVWERESDADWRECLEREREWEWEVQRCIDQGQPVDASDEALLRSVPWRGFDWEEQKGSSGLPDHFRGREGGLLLEEPLMELTRKNIAPASHRFKTLQKYLRDQALLIDWPAATSDGIHARATSRYSGSGIGSSRSGPHHTVPYADANDAGYQTLSMVDPERAEYRQSRLAEQEQIVREQQTRMVQDRLARERERAINNRARGNSTGGQARATMYESAYSSTVAAPLPQAPSQPAEQSQQRPMRQQPAAQLDERRGRGISSPGLLENQFPGPPSHMNPNWSPAANARLDEQVTPPIRPFSFAVWAGRNGEPEAYSARSSPGPRPRTRYEDDGGSVRSGQNGGFFGRFGGSVTSFFGGSQGGVSGSMMDMHVGLDSDRRYTGSQLVHPRSVSMASPPRPRFFGRSSRSSSYVYETESAAPNRISQHEPVAAPQHEPSTRRMSRDSPSRDDNRKKGFKGFLKKLGGGKKKQKGLSASPEEVPTPRSARTEDDFAMPLAPPPPLSYLVDRSDRRPNHQRTLSGNSNLGPQQSQSHQGEPQGWPHPQQQRSVSAPLVKSASSGSLPSTSPTSSRYQPWRDPSTGRSPAQQQDGAAFATAQRRQSAGRMSGLGGPDRSSIARPHDSGLEMLEHDPAHRAAYVDDAQAARGGYHKPPSLSNSSGTFFPTSVESPGLGTLRFPSQALHAPGGPHTSLDKQKSLPPLPMENRSPSSPDSFNAFFGDRYTYDERAHPQRQAMQAGWTPQDYTTSGDSRQARRTSAGQQSYSSGRSSLRGDGADGARRSRSRFGLKSLFVKDGKRASAEVQEETGAEAWHAAQRRGGDPRQRQTYYT